MLVQLSFPGSLNKYNGHYKVDSNQSWNDLIRFIVGNNYYFLFDIDDRPKPYLAIYLNNKKLLNLNNLACENHDILILLSATSGG